MGEGFNIHGMTQNDIPQTLGNLPLFFKDNWWNPIVLLVSKDNEEKVIVDNCKTLLNVITPKTRPYDYSERNTYLVRAVICQEINLLMGAAASKQTHLKNFSLDKNTPYILPYQLAMVLSKNRQKNLEKTLPWGEINLIKTVDIRSSQEAIYRDSTAGEQKIKVVAFADFNHDGFEDLLLQSIDTVVDGGSYFYIRLFILTKLSKTADISLIKQYEF